MRSGTSLKKKIQISFSLLITIVFIVTAIIMVVYFSSIQVKNTKKYSGEIVKRMSRELDLNLLQIQNLMNIVAGNDLIGSAMERSKADFAWRAVDFIQNLIIDYPEIKDVILLNKVGYAVVGTGQPVKQEYNFYQQPWFYTGERGMGSSLFINPHKEDYYIQKGGANDVVSLLIPFGKNFDMGGLSDKGWILCNINIIELKNITKTLVPGQGSTTLIYDTRGKALFYSNPVIPEVLPHIEKEIPLLVKTGNYNSLLIRIVSPLTGWTLASFIPYREILKDLGILIYAFGASTFIALSITLIVASKLSKKISKPIEEMAGSIKNIGKGNFAISLYDKRATSEIADLGKNIDNMIVQIITYQKNIRDTQLFALQEQINPHFLFNTLQSIKSLTVDNRGKDIRRITTILGEILRYGMYDPWELVPLEKELEYVEKYLTIQSYRFPGQFSYSIDFPEGLSQLPVMKLIIQPIVENAIIHGFDGEEGKKIDISATREHGGIALIIADNGKGISTETLLKIRNDLKKNQYNKEKIGIGNVQERIKLLYDKYYGIEINSEQNRGCTVIIHIPEKYDKDEIVG